MNTRRIAGLKGAVTLAQRAVDANKANIAMGIDYRYLLRENEARLQKAQDKLKRAQLGEKP